MTVDRDDDDDVDDHDFQQIQVEGLPQSAV